MSVKRARSDAGIATPRGVAVGLVLFLVGTGIGLVASGFVPRATAATSTATAGTQPVAAQKIARNDCVPASLRARAAQALVVGIPHVTTATDPLALEVLSLGVGGVFINDGNAVDAEQVRDLTRGLRAGSTLPLLITTDEESGRVSSFRPLIGGTSSPRTLAATMSVDDVRAYAAELGEQLADLGLNSDLAPVADLDAGTATGVIGDRAFSDDPLLAGRYAEAFAAGLADAGLLPVVKHFPGHGAAGVDVHKRGATIDTSLEDLLAADVMPFIDLIEAGAPVVMVGHPTYTALDAERPASVSKATYRLLRDLGFEGVAMTDSIGMGAIHRRWDFPKAAVMSLKAGADAVLATDGRQAAAMVDAIVNAVEKGKLDEARLDEAVARVLAVKGVDPALLSCAQGATAPRMARDNLVAKG